MSNHSCPTGAGTHSFIATADTETTDRDAVPPSSSTAPRAALFSLGKVVATPPAMTELNRKKLSVLPFLWRHQSGDWNAMNSEDAATNRRALTNGDRIFSSFQCDDLTLWVITEADRSSTCVLLPSCY